MIATAPIAGVAVARCVDHVALDALAAEAGLSSDDRRILSENELARVPVAQGTLVDLVADVLAQRQELGLAPASCGAVILTHSLDIDPASRATLDELLRDELPDLSRPPLHLSGRPCSILHLGIELAVTLRESRTVLVLGADVAPDHDARFFFGSAMGDAAVGILLGEPGFGELLAVRSDTHVLADQGAASPPDDVARFRAENPSAIRALLEATMADADMGWDSLAAIVPHTPYRLIWDTVSTLCRFPREQILDVNLCETGHMNSNDVLHHLASSVAGGKILSGEIVAMLSPGFGGTRGCTILRYDPHSS